jgi:hypothetical protein
MHHRITRLVLGALPAVVLFSSSLSAAVIGSLSLSNLGNGGVVVSATRTDFQQPANPVPGPPGFGVFQVTCVTANCTGSDTNLTYTGPGNVTTSLTPGELGQVLDLDITQAGLFPSPGLNQFITLLPGVPASSFDLTLKMLGGGQSVNDCASFSQGVGCSPFITFMGLNFQSPFVLTYLGIVNGKPTTSIALNVGGTATDASNQVSQFNGAFTTQVVNQTPAQIESTINGGGSITSSYSAQLAASFTPIPEPSTWALALGGLLMAFGSTLRLRKKA